jgi:DNA-binding CsgD family transcriptional regulator
MSTRLGGGDHDVFGGDLFPSDAEWAHIGSRLRWSAQELRVVKLLVSGASCKRTAFVERLALSTVHTYRRRAMRKARVGTLPGLVWTVVGRATKCVSPRTRREPREPLEYIAGAVLHL